MAVESIFIVGLASGLIALTIARSYFFEWFRNFVVNFSELIFGENFAKAIHELVNCHYCLGHWTSLFLVISTFEINSFIEFITMWFSVTAFAVLFSSTVNFLMIRSK